VLTLISPVSFSHVTPALDINLVSVVCLEERGMLPRIALASTFASLSITAATDWAAARTVGLMDSLLVGI
jgi:hypothetical protein